MKTLRLKLRKNGFDYVQVLRGRGYAIYEQRVCKDVRYFELFKIKVKPERTVCGKKLEASEIFPSNESFGYWAWTYPTLKKALTAMYNKSGIKYHWI